jgi:hypothetical protein
VRSGETAAHRDACKASAGLSGEYITKEIIMADEMKTASNWAKELGIPEKKFKDAIKAAAIQPDAKKGGCSYFSRASAEKIKKAAK